MHDRGQMDEQIKTINKAMQSLEKTARGEIKKDEDKLLVASALMAVTRNLYVEAIGANDTALVFASIADSFFLTEEMIKQYKPTIHQEENMNLLKDLWGHLKEWNEWKMKDWIKAGIVAIIVLIVLKTIIVPGA